MQSKNILSFPSAGGLNILPKILDYVGFIAKIWGFLVWNPTPPPPTHTHKFVANRITKRSPHSGWPDLQIIPCNINWHTKTDYGDDISFLFFFYGHSMESLSAINLFGQLKTLMVLRMVIQCFYVILALFCRQTTFYFIFTLVRAIQKSGNFKTSQWESPSSNFRI